MADIKLKNYLGESKPYSGVPKVWLESVDSTEENRILLPFAYGDPVSAEIDPDFSSGNMDVEIPEGKLIAELTIKKPPALVPANIAEGVEIAGIIGALAAGGGGGPSGSIQIKTGTYKPPTAPSVFGTSVGTYEGFKINSKGFWEKTITTEEFVPVAGRLYYLRYFAEEYRKAEAHSSFSNYGKCVTLGNKAIATGKQEDILGSEVLIIYQVNLKRLIILAVVSGSKYTDSGETWQPDGIRVWDVEENKGGVTIEHGGNSAPDAVFILQPSAQGLGGPVGNYFAAWGLRSSLAHLMKNNKVAGNVGRIGTTSAESPLESTYNSTYLHCPDAYTFSFQPNADYVVFSPDGSDCWWFAIWGLAAESE